MYIEVLVLWALLITFVILKLWFWYSKRRAIKKYKPENDKARKGGVSESGGRESPVVAATSSSARLDESEERGILQATTIDNLRKHIRELERTNKSKSGNGRSTARRKLLRR